MTSALWSRMGVDINQKLKLEPAIDWAIANDVPYIDLCLDPGPRASPGPIRRGWQRGRERLEREGIKLGLHTLSAVNIAEMSPIVSKPPTPISRPISTRPSGSAPAGSSCMAATISRRQARPHGGRCRRLARAPRSPKRRA